MSGVRVEFDIEALRPVIEAIVSDVIAKQAGASTRILYSEKEAATLLGMAVHQLRDRRLEGLIKGKKIGNSHFYSVDELRRFAK